MKTRMLHLGSPPDSMREMSMCDLRDQYGILAFWATLVLPTTQAGPRKNACMEIIGIGMHLNSGLKLKGGAAA